MITVAFLLAFQAPQISSFKTYSEQWSGAYGVKLLSFDTGLPSLGFRLRSGDSLGGWWQSTGGAENEWVDLETRSGQVTSIQSVQEIYDPDALAKCRQLLSVWTARQKRTLVGAYSADAYFRGVVGPDGAMFTDFLELQPLGLPPKPTGTTRSAWCLRQSNGSYNFNDRLSVSERDEEQLRAGVTLRQSL